MKIDGYIPADPELAYEIGVELNYKTQYGEFNFRAKHNGSDNIDFKKAGEKLNNKRAVREKLGTKTETIDDLRETLEIWHDHVIISWSTTTKSGGKEIETTRENFIELLSKEIFVSVFLQLTSDSADVSNFIKVAEAEAEKN